MCEYKFVKAKRVAALKPIIGYMNFNLKTDEMSKYTKHDLKLQQLSHGNAKSKLAFRNRLWLVTVRPRGVFSQVGLYNSSHNNYAIYCNACGALRMLAGITKASLVWSKLCYELLMRFQSHDIVDFAFECKLKSKEISISVSMAFF